MQANVRPRFVPAPYQDAPDAGRLILRDGSTAFVRVAHPHDQTALTEFFARLPRESRQRRFFSPAPPEPNTVASLCDDSNPLSCLTLLVTRTQDSRETIVATGSYLAKDARTAEVAFAVDASLEGKGLGTLLLERLAILAARNGFTRFWAITHADNRSMREVFRQSGFTVEEQIAGGDIAVNLSVVPNEESVARMEVRDRVATVASLRPFFRPAAVAVIGASRDPASIGYRIVEGLVLNRFQGAVYPVNPKANVIACIPALPSAAELPPGVDLAIIVVPAARVLEVVDACAPRGVRAVVVISAGFAEVDAAGQELQRRLVEKVRGHGMRLIGPNCLGYLNTDPSVRLNASFSPVFPRRGRIAMSSQSGALGLAVLAAAEHFGLGLSTFVSVGNKADVSGNDLLQYWEEDEQTDVILLYLESFGNPRRFARVARRVSQRKPIVAIKSGRSQAGGRAASSHTAALAAREVAVDALFLETGVIRADTLEEMFDLASALASQPLPSGRRVAIVTNAGGPAILCADACEAGELTVPALSDSTRTRLATGLPTAASTANPVDMLASATPENYARTIETVLTSGEVDALIAIYIPVGLSETPSVIAAIQSGVSSARAAGAHLPVLACLMGANQAVADTNAGHERIPCYAFPEAAARALARVAAYSEWRRQPAALLPDFDDLDLVSAQTVCRQALAADGHGWLDAAQTRRVLSAARLPLPPGGFATSLDETIEMAREVGFPVAIKLASRRLVHKTELGGVYLNLGDARAVCDAYESLRNRLAQSHHLQELDGVIVQPMMNGIEVMAGVTQDPLFGPLIAFGLGGVHVEILADVCFRIAPLTDRAAAEMVRGIRGYRLLQGFRGHPPADTDAIEEVLLRLSRLVEEVPEISEIDLNPLFVHSPGQGCIIADARIAVRSPT